MLKNCIQMKTLSWKREKKTWEFSILFVQWNGDWCLYEFSLGSFSGWTVSSIISVRFPPHLSNECNFISNQKRTQPVLYKNCEISRIENASEQQLCDMLIWQRYMYALTIWHKSGAYRNILSMWIVNRHLCVLLPYILI